MGRHRTRGGHRYYTPRGGGYSNAASGAPPDYQAAAERIGDWIGGAIPTVLFVIAFSALITLAKSCGGPAPDDADSRRELICVSPSAVPDHYDPEWYLTHTTDC